MRTNQRKRFITLALVAVFTVAFGAGSEASAARLKTYSGKSSYPRPQATPTSGEPDQTNGIPAPPKLEKLAMQRSGSGIDLTFKQWVSTWGRITLKR